MIIRVLVLAIVVVLLNSSPMSASGTVSVYFIDFEAETYVAVTTATIASHADEKWTISSKPDKDRLLAILNQGHDGNSFDENRVRALVVVDDKSYFVDRNGVVRNGGLSIDKSAFYKFRDSLSPKQRHLLTRRIGEGSK